MKISFFTANSAAFTLLLAFLSKNAAAQNSNRLGIDEFPRATISTGLGTNIFMLFQNAEDLIDKSDTLDWGSINYYASPTFNLNFDYAITPMFSLGVAVGRNRFGLDFTDLDFTSSDGQTFIRGDVDARVTRTSVTLRPLLHYGRTEKIDMYSGLRVGMAWWGFKFIGDGEAKAQNEFQKSFKGKFGRAGTLWPSAGATLFGITYYPIENLGIGGELNAGGPYGLAATLNYRF